MRALYDEDVFKQYYQTNYDFNTTSLDEDEIDEINKLIKGRTDLDDVIEITTGDMMWKIVRLAEDVRADVLDILKKFKK